MTAPAIQCAPQVGRALSSLWRTASGDARLPAVVGGSLSTALAGWSLDRRGAQFRGQGCNPGQMKPRALLKSRRARVFSHRIPESPQGAEVGRSPVHLCLLRSFHLQGSVPALRVPQ